jgi:enoyl reductase-like protein
MLFMQLGWWLKEEFPCHELIISHLFVASAEETRRDPSIVVCMGSGSGSAANEFDRL